MSMSFLKEVLIALPILLIVAILASQLVVVPTESMKPAINEGDMVLVEKTDVLGLFSEMNPETVKVGDIIIYAEEKSAGESSEGQGEESSVIHRVIEVEEVGGEKYFFLKGDNNPEPDEGNVSVDRIQGRAVTWGGNPVVIPKIGWVILWFKGGNEAKSTNIT